MKQIDFTPQWYATQLRTGSNRKRRLAFVAAICALMLCWFVVNESRIQNAQADLRVMRENNQQSQLLSARLNSLKADEGTLRRQIKSYQALLSMIPPSTIFAEISHRIPSQAWLVDFTLEPLSGNSGSSRRSARRSKSTGRSGGEYTGHCDLRASITAYASSSEEMYGFVRNLRESPLFEELRQGGMNSRKVQGTIVKEKTIELFVLSAECIAP